jgi:hypothetical protein
MNNLDTLISYHKKIATRNIMARTNHLKDEDRYDPLFYEISHLLVDNYIEEKKLNLKTKLYGIRDIYEDAEYFYYPYVTANHELADSLYSLFSLPGNIRQTYANRDGGFQLFFNDAFERYNLFNRTEYNDGELLKIFKEAKQTAKSLNLFDRDIEADIIDFLKKMFEKFKSGYQKEFKQFDICNKESVETIKKVFYENNYKHDKINSEINKIEKMRYCPDKTINRLINIFQIISVLGDDLFDIAFSDGIKYASYEFFARNFDAFQETDVNFFNSIFIVDIKNKKVTSKNIEKLNIEKGDIIKIEKCIRPFLLNKNEENNFENLLRKGQKPDKPIVLKKGSTSPTDFIRLFLYLRAEQSGKIIKSDPVPIKNFLLNFCLGSNEENETIFDSTGFTQKNIEKIYKINSNKWIKSQIDMLKKKCSFDLSIFDN